MNYFSIALGSIVLLPAIIGACSEPAEFPENRLTVAEVKSVYADITQGNTSGRQESVGIAWEEAAYRDLSIGQGLVFPLEKVADRYVSSSEDGVLYPVYNTAYAFAYKDDEDLVHLEYVQAVPTANSDAFTGYVTVADWDEEAKHIFRYEDGQLVEEPENGRQEACEEIFYFDCTAVHIGGELYRETCVYSHSVLSCHNDVPPTLAPDDYGPGGGANPNPSGLCPHPELAGDYVNCDQIICPPGHEPKPGGGCQKACPEGHTRDAFGQCNDPADCNTTYERLQNAFPEMSEVNARKLAAKINELGKDFGIDNVSKLHHFLGQSNSESGGFNSLNVTESMYYRKPRLLKVFPSSFADSTTATKKNVNDYIRNPEKLGNFIYAHVNGNGNEASGDGYKYRGRGLIQITGRTYYEQFTNFYKTEFDSNADFLANPEQVAENTDIAIISALWYFKEFVFDKTNVDEDTTVDEVTDKINAAMVDLEKRETKTDQAKEKIADCIDFQIRS
ncbi:MAG: hypothetical protein WBA74_22970 [Cyclobacteriaceae bacterium]